MTRNEATDELEQIETAISIDGMLKMLNWSRAKFYNKRQELLDAGVIFFRYEGRPPKRRTYGFPSRIHKWISLKTQKGEMI